MPSDKGYEVRFVWIVKFVVQNHDDYKDSELYKGSEFRGFRELLSYAGYGGYWRREVCDSYKGCLGCQGCESYEGYFVNVTRCESREDQNRRFVR